MDTGYARSPLRLHLRRTLMSVIVHLATFLGMYPGRRPRHDTRVERGLNGGGSGIPAAARNGPIRSWHLTFFDSRRDE